MAHIMAVTLVCLATCSPTYLIFTLRRKEKLWPHTREFADRAIAHVSNMLKKLQEVGEPCSLYTVRPYSSLACFAPLLCNTKGKNFIFPFGFLFSVPGGAELV